jgi:hypothetical protein
MPLRNYPLPRKKRANPGWSGLAGQDQIEEVASRLTLSGLTEEV